MPILIPLSSRWTVPLKEEKICKTTIQRCENGRSCLAADGPGFPIARQGTSLKKSQLQQEINEW